MKLLYTHQQETVVYAAEELKKCVVAISGGAISPEKQEAEAERLPLLVFNI